jgi:S-formylglutathione hydrolase FrmB
MHGDRGQGRWERRTADLPRGVRLDWVRSPSFGRDVGFLIYLPPGIFSGSDGRLPVLYWLHGLEMDPTAGLYLAGLLGQAIRAGHAPRMAVVFVDGLADSYYCDSADGERPVETMIVRELVPYVDGAYRTIRRREARAVEGFSMGGFGALHLGLKHPNVFGSISALGAAAREPAAMACERPQALEHVFGGDAQRYRRECPHGLLQLGVEGLRGRTPVRLIVGADDPLAACNRQLHRMLRRLRVEHSFEVPPGVGHSDEAIYRALGDRAFQFYSRVFGLPR